MRKFIQIDLHAKKERTTRERENRIKITSDSATIRIKDTQEIIWE